jgi:hypothetical protein
MWMKNDVTIAIVLLAIVLYPMYVLKLILR